MTEVQTLIEAHAFDDLQADIDVLIAELEIGHSDHAVEGLLSLASNANSRFIALKEDYVRWRTGSKVTPQVKLRLSRHLEQFHKLLRKTAGTLNSVGRQIEYPSFPHTPLPAPTPVPSTSIIPTITTESATPLSNDTKMGKSSDGSKPSVIFIPSTQRGSDAPERTMSQVEGTPLRQFLPTHHPSQTSPRPTDNSASLPVLDSGLQFSLNGTSFLSTQLTDPTAQFHFPPTSEGISTEGRRSTLNFSPSLSSVAARQAKEAELNAREAEQQQRSASRMEEERQVLASAVKLAEQDEMEERELLKRAEEVRQRKELRELMIRERMEAAEREERERMNLLKRDNDLIRHELNKVNSPSPRTVTANGGSASSTSPPYPRLEQDDQGLSPPPRASQTPLLSSHQSPAPSFNMKTHLSAFRPVDIARETGSGKSELKRPSSKKPPPLVLLDDNREGETKDSQHGMSPGFEKLVSEMTNLFKT